MEALNTVMSLDAFNLWDAAWHVENNVTELYSKVDFLSRWELAKLEHQAEISFGEGMKEERERILKSIKVSGVCGRCINLPTIKLYIAETPSPTNK